MRQVSESLAKRLWRAIDQHDLDGLMAASAAGATIGRRRQLGRGLDGAPLHGNALGGAAVAHWSEGVAWLCERTGHPHQPALKALAQRLTPEDPERMALAHAVARQLDQRTDARAEACMALAALRWDDEPACVQARAFLLDHLRPRPAGGGIWGMVFAAAASRAGEGGIDDFARRGLQASLMEEEDLTMFHQRVDDACAGRAWRCFEQGLDTHITLFQGSPAWQSEARRYLAEKQTGWLETRVAVAQGHRRVERL